MATFTLGQSKDADDVQDRYESLPVKERALRQFKLRLEGEDWTYRAIRVERVQRLPLTDRAVPQRGAVIGIVDMDERFGTLSNQTQENVVDINVAFVIPAADDEEASTLLNLFAADIIGLLSGQHNLTEETTGTQLSVHVRPLSFKPYYDEVGQTRSAFGEIQFQMIYRHRLHKPHTPAGSFN